MAKQRAITDEEIITALLQGKTMQQAAECVGLSVRALYDRVKEPAFIALYSKVRADLLRETTAELLKHTAAATATMVEIMQDTEQKGSTRLQAAQAILDNAAKFTKHLQATEDAATLEYIRQNKEHSNNMFDVFGI